MQREALTDLEETAQDKTKSGGRTDKGREGAERAEREATAFVGEQQKSTPCRPQFPVVL